MILCEIANQECIQHDTTKGGKIKGNKTKNSKIKSVKKTPRIVYPTSQQKPKLGSSQIQIRCLLKWQKSLWKRQRKCWLPAFSCFPTLFQKRSFLRNTG